MTPDFNRLKVFFHIHRNRSVAAAARELHVTQSAVSQHLRKLETEIKTHSRSSFPAVQNSQISKYAQLCSKGIMLRIANPRS